MGACFFGNNMKSFVCLFCLVIIGSCVSLFCTGIDYVLQGGQEIRKQLPERFFIERLLVEADIPLGDQDLSYLQELKENSVVQVDVVEKTCFYLQQSRRWKDICLQISHGQRGFVIVFNLQANWLIRSIKVNGLWFGKETLKQRCLLKGGDVFDQHKYEESIKRSTIFLKKMGYRHARVEGSITRNEKRKHVAVVFTVKRGALFTIKSAHVLVIGKQRLLCAADNEINKQLRLLNNTSYNHQRLKKFIFFLRGLLVHTCTPGAPITVREKTVGASGVSIDFVVDALPEHIVRLEGNKRFSTQELFTAVLADNAHFSCPAVPFLINGIKRYYHAHGFLLVSVTARYGANGWLITIDEGVQIHVRAIDFKGANPLYVHQLTALCDPLVAGRVDEQLLQHMHDVIVAYYERAGFWDIQIVEQEFEACAGDGYRVVFTIEEGNQRFLKNIRVVTDIPAIYAALQACVPVVGQIEPFDWSIIERDKQKLTHEIQKFGVDAQASYELITEPDGMVVQWHVIKKEPLVFGKTVFVGTTAARYNRLADMLSYRAGQPFDVALLGNTFNNLNAEDIFDAVRVFPLQHTDPLGCQPIGIELSEGDPFEAQARVGLIGTNNLDLSTYTLGCSLFGKNITSHMDTLTINVEFTRFARDCTLWYRYPRVVGLPFTFHARLFDKKTDVFCSQVSDCVLYTAIQRGVAFQGDYYSDLIKAMISAGIEGIKITHLFEPAARALLFEPMMRNHYEPYGVIEPALDITHVDDVLNPHRGFIVHVGARVMYAFGARAANFTRLLYEQSCFIPFSEHVVGALRLRGGYIFCTSFERLIPSERFYLGGSCSVRSYQQDYMPPLVCADNGGCCLWMPLGSRVMGSINTEVRVSLNKNLGFVIFQDIGALKNEHTHCFYVGGATGCGVRYITPIGPLRFDIGIKNKPAPDDRWPLAWFLTIGHAF